MRPITEAIPKALIPINGVPFARLQLELLTQQGIEQVLYLIGHLGEMIVDEIGDGHEFGLSVAYLREENGLLGTAGALRRAAEVGLVDDEFLVLYGDSYLPIEFAPVMHQLMESDFDAVMTVLRNKNLLDSSNTSVDGDRVVRYEKGAAPDPALDYIDYGLSALTRLSIVDLVALDQVADLGAVYATLAARGALGAHVVHERFFEIGSDTGLADFQHHLAERKISEN
jgi:NDP-sugar pyrophosphorylase family protein